MDYGYNPHGIIANPQVIETLLPQSDYLFVHRKKRFRTFHEIGTTCLKCSLRSTHLLIWHEKNIPAAIHYDYAGRRTWSDDLIIMTLDHIVPKSKGGSDKAHNLQPLCYTCNKNKKDMPNEEFMKK